MDVVGPENVTHAIKQAEATSGQISHQTGNTGLGVENQLPGASDIASARSFFTPKMDVQATAAPLSSVEHSSALAVKAASDAISPMLQIIMRLPGHLGVFSSFLECLKNLFMPHDLLTNFNPVGMVSGIDLTHATGLTHLGHSLPSLAGQHPMDLSILPSSAHAFHTLSGEFIGSAGSAHLHMNAFDTLKQSANVSAGVDINNPQFEGVSSTAQASNNISGQFSGHGDSLAGPGISAQAITPKLAPAQTIFSSKFFESASNSHSSANTLLAANNQNVTTGITGGASSTIAPHLTPSVNSANVAAPTIAEHSQSSSGLSGLQAKALSFNDVLHKHMPSHVIPKHIANNPFANLASNTKLAFQTAQMDNSAITNNVHHIKSGDSHLQTAYQSNHKIFSHTESANGISNSLAGHNHGSLANHYTVKPGDSLWKISQNAFGSGEKWTQLYKLNNGVIGSNPSMIFSGQKLALSGFNANVIHPQPHVQHIEQLAHHSQPNTSTVAHVQDSVHHAQATSPAAAHNPVKHTNSAIADAKVPHVPVQQAHFQGLAVEKVPDQVLTGSGGAQAATNTSAAVNKAAGQVVASKAKSVVSFSLAPDLSFLDGQK